VLKNRILTFTSREFDEKQFGADSFREFVERFPDIVSVDASVFPPVVRLIDESAGGHDLGRAAAESEEGPRREITARHRVRQDLWQAMLDYSSGREYIWEHGHAVPVEAGATPDETLILPTISPETLAGWRDAFVSTQAKFVTPRRAQLLEAWKEGEHGSAFLPGGLRGQWNAFLKRQVLDTLESWFAEHSLDAPDDLVVTDRSTTSHQDADQLRSLIRQCLDVMTVEELASIQLPAAAVQRALKNRRE
jgi:hypothetical protein